MTSEKFERLQYETYKAIYLSFIAFGVACLIAISQTSGTANIVLKIFNLIFWVIAFISLGLFFKFYAKLRERYTKNDTLK